MSSVCSLLIGAPRATRTRIVRSGCGDHRRRRWRRLYVHRRCRGLHAVASGSRERSASAGGVFLLPPTRGWRRVFPQKPDEQWQQQRQREQQLWRHIFIAQRGRDAVVAACDVQFILLITRVHSGTCNLFVGANFHAAVNVIGQPTPVWPPRQRQRSTDRERCATRASSSSAAAIRA